MPYITPEIRTGYFSATAMASNLIGTGVALLTSLMTQSLTSVQQLRVFSILRIVAFGIAALDVYFLQKPKEPVYILSSNRPSLMNIIRLPLANKKFALTMLAYFLYTLSANLAASVLTTWQLQTVKTGYVYPSVINVVYPLFVIATSGLWGKVMWKLGNFKSLAITCAVLSVTYFAYAFVNHSNFLWLMTVVRLVQHGIGMLQHYSVNNLIYLNLPKEDQTCYTSFYTIIANLGAFLSMTIGTWVVARMDQLTVRVFTVRLGSVPLMLLAQGVCIALTAIFVLLIRKHAEPEGRSM
jgi:MFS family permease